RIPPIINIAENRKKPPKIIKKTKKYFFELISHPHYSSKEFADQSEYWFFSAWIESIYLQTATSKARSNSILSPPQKNGNSFIPDFFMPSIKIVQFRKEVHLPHPRRISQSTTTGSNPSLEASRIVTAQEYS
ncbi:hypothetical protein, partial [Holdemania filiformis]|uniref:hypothetical protein n=1 Tax=Holdemania filiformis TaxID=61171 RepID=UPI0026775044